MKTEYFPDVDLLSFLFEGVGKVEDGRDVEGDQDVLVLYDEDDRIVEIVIHNASERIALDQVKAAIITGPPKEEKRAAQHAA